MIVNTSSSSGAEVAHIASLLSRGSRVVVYGVLPMQMDLLKRSLHAQEIDSILSFLHTCAHTHNLVVVAP